MVRPLAAALAMSLVLLSAFGIAAWAEGQGKSPDDVPEALVPALRPPDEFRDALGSYKSPLTFDDGRPVRDAAGWRKRR